jgi:copper chaperone CopZ
MNTVTYSVPAISCQHCVHTIVTELSDMTGVQSVQGDLQTKQVKINFDQPATPEKIEELLAEINYPVAK